MSYTETIVQALIDTLSRTAGLPTFQMAGHVPNLDFWVGEVLHAKTVLSEYKDRFDRMVAAQAAYDMNNPDRDAVLRKHDYDYAPLKVALTPEQTNRLMRQLNTIAERLIGRCQQEELINLSRADDLRELAKLPPFDSKNDTVSVSSFSLECR